MKICTKCNRKWPDEFVCCPMCGVEDLVSDTPIMSSNVENECVCGVGDLVSDTPETKQYHYVTRTNDNKDITKILQNK